MILKTMTVKQLLPVLCLLILAACSSGSGSYSPSQSPTPATGQKVGRPYQIGGIWYYPAIDHDYDRVGVASWYGPNFHGKPTANGEVFDMNKVSAAHPTLPLPSMARVTNLENGRAITVRINDRGPFARERIIDMSRRAAQLLGFQDQGTTRVRVQVVRPDGSLADGGKRSATPRQLAADTVVPGPFFIQIGSFADRGNADRVYHSLNDLKSVIIQAADTDEGQVFRVRIGPFGNERDARRILDRVFDRGYHDARIFTDRLG
jgi:rare lipoprotein A